MICEFLWIKLFINKQAPPLKAGTGRHEAPVMATQTEMSCGPQTEISCGPAKASVKVGGPFSDGIHAGASPV